VTGDVAELPGISVEDRLARYGADASALRALDPRIVDECTLYGGGIVHVFGWMAAGQPRLEDCLGELEYGGDPTIERAVRLVLDQVPAPVAHRVCTGAVIVGVSIDTLGWVDRFPDVPPNAARVVLGCAAPGLICHELAHVMHQLPLSPKAPASARERKEANRRCRMEIARALVASNAIDALVEFDLEPEHMADAAASLWMGDLVDTCGRRRREAIRADIERLAKEPGEPIRDPRG
jgi:hypothetical protein